MRNRPKYYIGRSFLIYFLTLFTGTIISSFILSCFEPVNSFFFESVITYLFFGMMLTCIWCIPLLFILVFGFWYIYSRYEDEQQKWKGLRNLSIICIAIPLGITFFVGLTDFSSLKKIFPWVLVMISYASSGVFFILYISKKADLRNPPQKVNNRITPELDDILDSGFDNEFEV